MSNTNDQPHVGSGPGKPDYSVPILAGIFARMDKIERRQVAQKLCLQQMFEALAILQLHDIVD